MGRGRGHASQTIYVDKNGIHAPDTGLHRVHPGGQRCLEVGPSVAVAHAAIANRAGCAEGAQNAGDDDEGKAASHGANEPALRVGELH